MSWDQISSKVFLLPQLEMKVSELKDLGEKIVFTNGCFDLIHLGHLKYLAKAKELGNFFIVAVNSDASVKRLKGNHRPIKDENTRSSLLASLSFVDAVIIFNEDTPEELIKRVLPDVLCKGGDWPIEDIVGATTVLNNGGTVKSIPFVPGNSTTSLEQKIKSHL